MAVEKILLAPAKLQQLQHSLLMFYLGDTRSASKILSEQKKATKSQRVTENLHRMVGLAEELRIELQSGRLDSFGDILHRGWMYKKELASGISNERINSIYESGMAAGATGGKLLGAGGTGFLLLCVPDEAARESVRQALGELREFEFQFESEGARVIYYSG